MSLIQTTRNALNILSPDQRSEFIIQILSCVPKEHLGNIAVHIKAVINDDFITLFPKEVSLHILSFASLGTLLSLSRVSKQWHLLLSDSVLWKIKFQLAQWTLGEIYLEANAIQKSFSSQEQEDISMHFETMNSLPRHFSLERAEAFMQLTLAEREELIDGIGTGSLPRDYNSQQEELNIISYESILQNRISPPLKCELQNDALFDWKRVYKERYLLAQNWNLGIFTKTELLGHREAIYCLQFDREKIISGSRDDSIKVWDVDSQICIQTFSGHSASVLCLEFDDM